MGLGDDSQNLHGISTTASRKTLPAAAHAAKSKINALLHVHRRFCRDLAAPARGDVAGVIVFCAPNCGNTRAVSRAFRGNACIFCPNRMGMAHCEPLCPRSQGSW